MLICLADVPTTKLPGVCMDSEFLCMSGECIDARLHCDRHYDCIDGSDEFDCCEFVSLAREIIVDNKTI